jgi:hypothetical protein
MASIGPVLRQIAAVSDQKAKIEQYKHVLDSVLASNHAEDAKAFVDHSKFLRHNCAP